MPLNEDVLGLVEYRRISSAERGVGLGIAQSRTASDDHQRRCGGGFGCRSATGGPAGIAVASGFAGRASCRPDVGIPHLLLLLSGAGAAALEHPDTR